jgi:hypothetical protein
MFADVAVVSATAEPDATVAVRTSPTLPAAGLSFVVEPRSTDELLRWLSMMPPAIWACAASAAAAMAMPARRRFTG